MKLTTIVSSTVLSLLQGDITQQRVDAIVNAANSSLLGGGGVDGAIHRAGGPQILAECRAIHARQGGCPVGKAVITSGGQLAARYVIHTVGPVWKGGGHGEEGLLARAYDHSLRLAVANTIRTIAFPSVSTGAYGFPVLVASKIAFTSVAEFVQTEAGLAEVRFVVCNRQDYEVYAPLFRI